MDSCFTGGFDGRNVVKNKGSALLAPKKAKINTKKLTIITAGTGKQYSNEFNAKGHRLFSYYLTKALLNNPRTIKGLFAEVHDNTKTESRKMGGNNIQTPVMFGNSKVSF